MNDFWKRLVWFFVPYSVFAVAIVAIPGDQSWQVIIGGAIIISVVSNVSYSVLKL